MSDNCMQYPSFELSVRCRRSCWFVLSVCGILFFLLLSGTGSAEESRKHPQEIDIPPLVGTIGGVPVAIPWRYYNDTGMIAGYIARLLYEELDEKEQNATSIGWSIEHTLDPHSKPGSAMWVWRKLLHLEGMEPGDWKIEYRTFEPNQQSVIKSIVVHSVRLSNYHMIETEQDFYDSLREPYVHNENYVPYEPFRFTSVAFISEPYQKHGGSLKPIYDKFLADAEPRIGPFYQRDDQHGLQVIASDSDGETLYRPEPREVFDLALFDAQNWLTLILCKHDRKVPRIVCDHYFQVPELKSIAIAHYRYERDIGRWRELEEGVKKIAHGFIVDTDKEK